MSTLPSKDNVAACKSVLLELSIIFKDFWADCVLIGGWVPYFILSELGAKDSAVKHVGSMDLDLLINIEAVGLDGYTATAELMRKLGYKPGRREFERIRTVRPKGAQRPVPVRVHLMAPASAQQGGLSRRRLRGGLQLLVGSNVDFALRNSFWHELTGDLPTGGIHTARVRIADEVACLVMKGSLIPRFESDGEKESDAGKDKDCYDLFMLLRHYPGGPDAFAERLRPYWNSTAVQAALANVRKRFADPAQAAFQWTVRYLARARNVQSAEQRDELENEIAYVFGRFLRATGDWQPGKTIHPAEPWAPSMRDIRTPPPYNERWDGPAVP